MLPALDQQAADRLMAMARADLAGRGHEATINAGFLELAGGQVYGLHNLSVLVSQERERHWPALVARHFDRMLVERDRDAPPDPGKVLVKLRMREDMPNQPEYEPLEPVPGVVALVAIDEPTVVVESLALPEGIPDIPTALRLARANLVELPAPEHVTRLLDEDDPSSRVHLFITEDFFGASRLLVLDRLLTSVGVTPGPGGLLVALPSRHVLAVHPMSGPGVVSAMNWLVRLAEEDSATAPGPISPHVYHLAHDGRTSRVTRPGESGGHAVMVEGAFQEAFLRVIGDDED